MVESAPSFVDSRRLVWEFHTTRGLVPAQSKPRLMPVHQRQAICALHPLPVIFIRCSTNDTDLIVLAVGTQPWPSKPMGARFADESLQECHVCPSLSQWQAIAPTRLPCSARAVRLTIVRAYALVRWLAPAVPAVRSSSRIHLPTTGFAPASRNTLKAG